MNLSRRSIIKNSFLTILAASIGFPGKIAQGSPIKKQKGSFRFTRDIPIIDKYDLVVAGGGPSGVAAAISAGRLGAKVLLIEATGCLGGMGTSGLVSQWSDITTGKEIHCNGIFLEILVEMHKQNALSRQTDPLTWGNILHAGTRFFPEPLKRLLDNMCLEAGVNILFKTQVIDADFDDQKKIINGVVIQNIEGYHFIVAKSYIDATGDAVIAGLCGVPSRIAGRDTKHIMAPTLCSQVTGGDIPNNTLQKREELIQKALDEGFFTVPEHHTGWVFMTTPQLGTMNAGHIFGMDALNARSLSDGYITGRKLAKEWEEFYKKYVNWPGFLMTTTGSLMGVRESRNIYGEYELNYSDLMSRKQFPDQIGVYAKKVDIHPYDTSKEELERFRKEYGEVTLFGEGEYYGIPYGILVPKGWKNIWVTGRAASMDVKVQGSLRDQPGCYILGQAAGTAAAQSVKTGQTGNNIDTEQLVNTLRNNGAYLPQETLSTQMTRS